MATVRQEERVYQYIKGCLQRWGYGPTMREIKDALFFSSTSVAWYWVQYLISDGRITMAPGKARTIRIIEGERP